MRYFRLVWTFAGEYKEGINRDGQDGQDIKKAGLTTLSFLSQI
jgi:hypothetical protein